MGKDKKKSQVWALRLPKTEETKGTSPEPLKKKVRTRVVPKQSTKVLKSERSLESTYIESVGTESDTQPLNIPTLDNESVNLKISVLESI